MSKLQKILLISGSIVLIILSSVLIFIDRELPEEDMATSSKALEHEEMEDGNNESVNVTEEITAENEEDMDINQADDREVLSYIEEAMNNVTLSTTHTEPNEQAFLEHAILNQYVTSLSGDRLSLEEEIEEEAQWVAKDLDAWLIVANEETNFQYETEDFLSFVEEEGFVTEDDLQTTAILSYLEEMDENLYIRHLEYHYIKPYIWSEVRIDLMEEIPQEADQTDEDYLFQLYLLFEEDVTNYLIENNPELLQE